MPALQSLRDATDVLRTAPWLFAAGALAAFVSTLDTAADSGLTALLDLFVGPFVTAGIVGVALVSLRNDRPRASFLDRAQSNVLRVLAAYLLAGIASLLVLLVPGLLAWDALKPALVTLVEGGTPAFGAGDVVVFALLAVVAFAVSLAFSLVAPAVVDGHGVFESLGESYSRVRSNLRAALGFGLVDGVVKLVAVGPGLYVGLAGIIENPQAAGSFGGTALLLLFVGGTVATTVGHVYATAFYERVGPAKRRPGRDRAARGTDGW
ncbi:hypothetical protein [Halorarius litoreus]|uniref:DUF7847 domain-containing protein n=1 Tax=Halorarius litoreus TaxID=2962676 RepID=UPI0020CDE7F8|nr:hypothetical protein [Halorarius litoreus]